MDLVRSSKRKRGAFRLRRSGRIWIIVEAWNVFTSDWKNGRNADEEGFIFDKVCIYIYSCKIVPRENSSKVGERNHARQTVDRINQNLSNLVKFLELFLGDRGDWIDSWNSYRSDKIEEGVRDQILFLLIIYGGIGSIRICQIESDTRIDSARSRANSVVETRGGECLTWLESDWRKSGMIFIRRVKFACLSWLWKRLRIIKKLGFSFCKKRSYSFRTERNSFEISSQNLIYFIVALSFSFSKISKNLYTIRISNRNGSMYVISIERGMKMRNIWSNDDRWLVDSRICSNQDRS